MRKTLPGIALTLASCALGSTATADEGVLLHDQVRSRVLGVVGSESPSAAAIRNALRGDPDFERLLDRLRREALASGRGSDFAEDATQETLLKIWQGRPEVFLLPHDEVVRYVRSASRRNLWTRLDRERTRAATTLEFEPEFDEDPAAEALSTDLLDQLRARLTAKERDALEQRLNGIYSQRDVASALGETRYSASRALEGLERKMTALLD